MQRMELMIFRKRKEEPEGPQEAVLNWGIECYREALLPDEPKKEE